MNDPSPKPQYSLEEPLPENLDPRWHDEEPEIQNDDAPRRPTTVPRRQPPRAVHVRRRYEED